MPLLLPATADLNMYLFILQLSYHFLCRVDALLVNMGFFLPIVHSTPRRDGDWWKAKLYQQHGLFNPLQSVTKSKIKSECNSEWRSVKLVSAGA